LSATHIPPAVVPAAASLYIGLGENKSAFDVSTVRLQMAPDDADNIYFVAEDYDLAGCRDEASAKLRKSTSYRRGDPLRSPDLREAAEGLPYTECGLTQASTRALYTRITLEFPNSIWADTARDRLKALH